MYNDNKFQDLIKELAAASKECWAAQLALHDLGNKYSPLCIQLVLEGRQIPKLINDRINKRKDETGVDPIHPDFWNADMIIALHEHFENNY
ncbi:MAG TPA: hypothetical protein VMR76_00965 [Candidatus Saccharimonadia bacterium]|nr:hypothetical protein [Candidatus Saccharimonadia bacterium]